MRRYETFVIIDPDLTQDQRDPLIGRVEELITQMDGFLVFTDDWGERKLAYEIKKKGRGYYVRFDYCGLPTLVNEIERFFRIDDRALKYMTVLLNKDADLESIKEEKAVAEKASADKESAEKASADKAAADKAAADKAAAEIQSEPVKAPEENQVKELAPKEEEEAKTDEDVPASETENAAADKTPSATKEEA